MPALAKHVAALEELVASLAQANANQVQEIATLKQRLNQGEGKLAYVSVQGQDMFITGANLYIDATVCGGDNNRATARFSSVGGGSGVVQDAEYGWSAGSFGARVQGSFVSP